ncbi:MAG: hypothetical protein OHK0053_03980 [Microscillaceae bacterium]
MKYLFFLPHRIGLSLFSLALLMACNDDERAPLAVPTTYNSPNFVNNTQAENTVLTELGNLVTAMNNAETGTTDPIAYPANLKAITRTTYATKIESWLLELVKGAGQTFDLENAPAGDGGMLGTRLLDENGLELEQMIEKGSFGAALYNHALAVLSQPISEADIDRLVRILGTDASFDPNTAKFSALYAKRRSDNSAQTGFFYDLKQNLLTAKAALAAGPEYQPEFNASLTEFLINWEKSNFATVIFYCFTAKSGFQNSNNDPTALGNALHAYAEGVGFTAGWKGISTKLISDAQIDQVLELLLAEEGQTPESYRFAKEPALLDRLDQIVALLQGIYGFSNEEIEAFKVNN